MLTQDHVDSKSRWQRRTARYAHPGPWVTLDQARTGEWERIRLQVASPFPLPGHSQSLAGIRYRRAISKLRGAVGRLSGQNGFMRQIRVLLVEDHDFTRTTVAASLHSEQCKVVASVPSARDALRAIEDHQVDCAVIDLNLGMGPTGLDLAHKLREHEGSLGIVLLTTFKDPRLLTGDRRSLPPGTVYLVKDDVRTTSQMRAAIETAVENITGKANKSALKHTNRLPLTDTQMEILRMVAEGLTNAEIAHRRGVSARAVQAAMTRILTNAQIEPEPGVDVRVQLARYFTSLGGTFRDN